MKKLIVVAALALAAMASPALAQAQKKFDFPICTGLKGYPYDAIGQMLVQFAKNHPSLNVRNVNTSGTGENITNTTETQIGNPNYCVGFIGQPDGVTWLKKTNKFAAMNISKVTDLHDEYLHVVCSRKSGVSSLQDLANKKGKLALGPQGSGTWILWDNLKDSKPALANVREFPEGADEAIPMLAEGDRDCTLIASGFYGKWISVANAQYGKEVRLVPADAWAFNNSEDLDGKPLYQFADIPGGTYKKLQDGMFSSSVATIKWTAGLYIAKDRVPANIAGDFRILARRATPGIVDALNNVSKR